MMPNVTLTQCSPGRGRVAACAEAIFDFYQACSAGAHHGHDTDVRVLLVFWLYHG